MIYYISRKDLCWATEGRWRTADGDGSPTGPKSDIFQGLKK